MSTDPSAERTANRGAKEELNLRQFALFATMTLLASLLMALCLYLAYRWGQYYLIGLPSGASLLVGAAAYKAIRASRCQDKVIAALFGMIAGALLYLGYYYIHFAAVAGLQNAHRIDRWPRFVANRVSTDTVFRDNDQGWQEVRLGPMYHWFVFSLELLLSMGIVATFAIGAADATRMETGCEPVTRGNVTPQKRPPTATDHARQARRDAWKMLVAGVLVAILMAVACCVLWRPALRLWRDRDFVSLLLVGLVVPGGLLLSVLISAKALTRLKALDQHAEPQQRVADAAERGRGLGTTSTDIEPT